MLTSQITLKLDLFIVIMSIPVSQLTVEQAPKEFNSLAEKIAAEYEQLDSDELGSWYPWLQCQVC